MNEESKRTIASRNNGKKGGVKTEEGKMVSSRNSFKHGILSNSTTDYDLLKSNQLYIDLVVEFKASTVVSLMLVEQLVICYVKLGRCNRFEQELLNETIKTKYEKSPLDTMFFGVTVPENERALISADWFQKMDLVLTRYEPQLVKRMITIINELQKMNLGSFGKEE